MCCTSFVFCILYYSVGFGFGDQLLIRSLNISPSTTSSALTAGEGDSVIDASSVEIGALLTCDNTLPTAPAGACYLVAFTLIVFDVRRHTS